MADTISTLGKAAGGAMGYLSGKEVFRDLSGGNFDAASSLADVGKTVILYSSVDNASYKLPNANTSGMVAGKGQGLMVLKNSKPIKLLNQGTPGTDDVLEAFMLPGSEGVVFTTSVATAKGDWRSRASRGWFHGIVPVKLGNLDVGLDIGAAQATSQWNPIPFMQNGGAIARLSDTLYVFCYQVALTSITAVAASYVHSTDTWTYGTPVTAFTHATDNFTLGGIIPLSATQYAICAWQATTAKATVRGGTVSGTVITQGTQISSGAWAVNPSNAGIATAPAIVADSASTFFWAGKYDGTALAVMHFSISGANVTQDGGSAFASSTPYSTGGVRYFGYSPSANNLDLGISSTNGNHLMARYTYSAGAVTAVNIPILQQTSIKDANGTLWCTDATNKNYVIDRPNQGNMIRITLNAGATAAVELQSFERPTFGTTTKAASIELVFLSDQEGFRTLMNAGTLQTATLFDTQWALRARQQQQAGTSSDMGITEHNIPAAANFMPLNGNYMTNIDIHKTTRRCVAAGPAYDNASTTDARRWRACMFDLPRNYDHSVAA